MKRTILVSIFLSIFLVGNASLIYQDFSFEYPDLKKQAEYVVVNQPGCLNSGKEGEPDLPYFGVTILLPPGEEISEVKILGSTYYPLKEKIVIKPAERQFPLSSDYDFDYQVKPDPNIYNSSVVFPANITGSIRTDFMNGHSIGNFLISTVKYKPALNQAEFLEEISLEIVTTTSARAQTALDLFKNKYRIEQRILKTVVNPETRFLYGNTETNRDEEYDLLLITNSTLFPHFQTYIDFKQARGFIVATETTEDIFLNYTGQDEQEKIRNCIIDYYENFNLSYVILGGDSAPNQPSQDVIPHRGFSATAYSTPDSDIPADIYYSNLDGNWNNDGDSNWGESGEEDLYSEISIGRICIDDQVEIENFTNKLMLYQDAPVLEDIEKALMVGELLWASSGTYAKPYKEEIANGSSNYGYTTVGISENFTINTLYEMDGYWGPADIYNQFNNVGINLLNHLGHSFTDYNMKIYVSDVNTTNFQNNGIDRGFVIGYSQGCYNGAFDNRDSWEGNYFSTDCFSEEITTLETAEVANIGNSRYGWGQHGSTDGASQYFDRQFFDAIFGENITTIGDANADSKEDNVPYLSSHEGAIKWCFYELNLFGDPSMDIWTAQPEDIVITYPASVPIGSQIIVMQTDTPFARLAVLQNGELIGRATADDIGNLEVNLFEPLSDAQPLEISITGHNKNRFTGTIVVVSDQPYVIFDNYQINDETGNNNGLADYGETIALDLTLLNVGNQPANDVIATISSNDEYVNIITGEVDFGFMDPESTMTIEDAFELEIMEFVPDQHTVHFDLEVSGSERDVWNSSFNLTLNAPVLTLEDPIVDDSVGGDNDGILDPGETAVLTFFTNNIGHATSPFATAIISCNEELVTIINTSADLGEIEAENSVSTNFEVSIDENMNIGVPVVFNYQVLAEPYEVENDFTLTIGLCIEDFESGDFLSYPWEFSGNSDWMISTTAYEGQFSARSGTIGNDQNTCLEIELYVMTDSEISFYKKTSTENNYDFFKFYIDGQLQEQWSGEVPWSQSSYAVSEGEHSFKWEYNKDGMMTAGSDCTWLDYIILPPNALGATGFITGNISTNPPGEYENTVISTGEYSVNADENGNYNLEIPYGTYDVTVSLQGYETITEEDVTVLPYETVTLDFILPFIAPPTGLEAEAVNQTIVLTWLEPNPGRQHIDREQKMKNEEPESRVLQYYKVYRNFNDGEFSFLFATTCETYTDNELIGPGTYGYYVTAIYTNNSESDPSETVYVDFTSNTETELTAVTRLFGNYPNPFNPETTIRFSLKQAGKVELIIYNLKGETVKILSAGELPSGNHSIVWYGDDEDGNKTSSGLYIYKFSAPDYTSVKKMILMK